MNLDELEAKARATKGAPTIQAIETARAQLERACDPDTILHLIERARAGEQAVELLNDCWAYIYQTKPCDFRERLLGALEESLAHSPQEAG